MSNLIEMRHLRYFHTLSRELHYGKAAKKLFISQPALTKQIQMLESYAGVKLINRNHKRVQLTDAGIYLQEKCERWIRELDESIMHIQRMEQGLNGTLKIGFLGSAMHNILPERIKKLHQHFPGIGISLEEMSNQTQIDQLLNQNLDLGFIRKSLVPPSIQIKAVYTETFSLVLPSNHPISKDNFQHMGQLSGEKFILFDRDYSEEYYDTVIQIISDNGFLPEINHKSIHATTIFRLVENEIGISIVPTSLASGYQLKIQFIPLENIPQRTTLYLAWNKDGNNPALQSYFRIEKSFNDSITLFNE